jgi:hypothetical protein
MTFNSGQNDHQITCLSTRTKEARVLALQLRQRHLDVMLGNAIPSAQVYGVFTSGALNCREQPSIKASVLDQVIWGFSILGVRTALAFLVNWKTWGSSSSRKD